MRESATDFLLKAQNPDGGWGVQAGKQSNTEVTALALLALGSLANPQLKYSIDRGIRWLVQTQKAGGGFPLMANVDEPSWASPLAVLALSAADSQQRAVNRGIEWVLRQKGQGAGLLGSLFYWWNPDDSIVKVNPVLTGWSWTAGTFSWVEPTAYALIALKRLRSYLSQDQAITRISEGERMIYDRMCVGGGWNYGNSKVLGENLWPYPDTTALALIALQDRSDNPANQIGLTVLEKMLAENHSGLALAWSCICFTLYGRDPSPWIARLEKSYAETQFLGETKPIALAVLATGRRVEGFRV
jgi:hypothetical protein